MITPPERLLACELSEPGAMDLKTLAKKTKEIYADTEKESKEQNKRLAMQKAPKSAAGNGQPKGLADLFGADSFGV